MLKVVKSLFFVLALQTFHPKVVYVVRAYWRCTIGCLQVRKFFAQNCVKDNNLSSHVKSFLVDNRSN